MYLIRLNEEQSKDVKEKLKERVENPPAALHELGEDVQAYLLAVQTLRDRLLGESAALRRAAEDLNSYLKLQAELELSQEAEDFIRAGSVLIRLAENEHLRWAEDSLDNVALYGYTDAINYMDEAEGCIREADDYLGKARFLMIRAGIFMERGM